MVGRSTLNLATAVVLGIGLIMATPVLGWQAPGAASQAPALADRLFRVEWSAGAAGQGQSRIVGYVYNEYREDAVKPVQYHRVLEKRLANEQLVAQQELLNEDAVIWALWAPWPGF
jgi:hypothetical protein